MNSLPNFLFCSNKTLQGAGLVFCTEVPFYIGQVYKGLTTETIIEIAEREKFHAVGKVIGYRIHVVIIGALHSTLITGAGQELANELATTARQMSDFYYEEKVVENRNYYKRYLE